MGVDARIYLPGNVRLRTVVAVVAKLLDAPAVKKNLPDNKPSDHWYVSIPDGVVEYSNVTQGLVGVRISQIDPSLRGSDQFYFSYHYEFGGYKNLGACRGTSLRSSATNIALFRALADFFGGVVDYQDCDGVTRDYVVEFKSDDLNCPEEGPPWQNLQERIMALSPLTHEQIDACEQYAAYENASERKRWLAMKRVTATDRAIESLALSLGQPLEAVSNALKKGGVM